MPEEYAALEAAKLKFSPALGVPKIVKVWVRLGPNENENERTLAFWIPDGIDPTELLEQGAAIDGTQAVLAVAWDDAAGGFQGGGAYTCPDLTDGGVFENKSLSRALGDGQRALVKYLATKGYKVQFA